jgi:hypothetical protein
MARAAIFGLLFHIAFGYGASAMFAAGELSFDGIALTPLSRVVPSGVLVLEASVGNSGDSSAEGTIVVSIDEFPNFQSARRIVLEPGQDERLALFVQLPEIFQDPKLVHITATMFVRYGQGDAT